MCRFLIFDRFSIIWFLSCATFVVLYFIDFWHYSFVRRSRMCYSGPQRTYWFSGS